MQPLEQVQLDGLVLDAVGLEEVVELHVVAGLGAQADPLAVADHQVAELPARVQLVEHPVGEVGPGHELEIHHPK